MPIHTDKTRGQFVFEFDRLFTTGRIRTRKRLPKTWSRTQADAFDRQESARLYALASGIEQRVGTIDEAIALYLADKSEAKTIQATAAELGQVYWAYHSRPITDLPSVALEIMRVEKERVKPATIRNRIAYLRAACRWAWKMHRLCEHDPGARVQVPSFKNEKTNYLVRKEVLQVARRTPNRAARAAILIGFYSGMRVAEVLRAKAVEGVWQLDDTKNGDKRYLPIVPKAAIYSRRWPRGIAKITVQKWARIGMTAIGRPDASFHTLRHSTATAILAAGESLDVVGDVLGHRDARSTKRYAHRQVGQLAKAMGSLGKKTPTV